jgi:hypothetical protein
MKAAVLPVPFLARARMSRPVRAMGIASSWIGDGRSNWGRGEGQRQQRDGATDKQESKRRRLARNRATYAAFENAHEQLSLQEVVCREKRVRMVNTFRNAQKGSRLTLELVSFCCGHILLARREKREVSTSIRGLRTVNQSETEQRFEPVVLVSNEMHHSFAGEDISRTPSSSRSSQVPHHSSTQTPRYRTATNRACPPNLRSSLHR